jgi:hypothetical protein
MTPLFDDSLPPDFLRSSACNDNLSPGDTGLTPNRRFRVKAMVLAEHFLKLVGLILMTVAASVCLTMWMVKSSHAQTQTQLQAETNATVKTQVLEIDRRLGNLEAAQKDQDLRISGIDSKINGVYMFGWGASTIMVVLQVFSILSQLKSKTVTT